MVTLSLSIGDVTHQLQLPDEHGDQPLAERWVDIFHLFPGEFPDDLIHGDARPGGDPGQDGHRPAEIGQGVTRVSQVERLYPELRQCLGVVAGDHNIALLGALADEVHPVGRHVKEGLVDDELVAFLRPFEGRAEPHPVGQLAGRVEQAEG